VEVLEKVWNTSMYEGPNLILQRAYGLFRVCSPDTQNPPWLPLGPLPVVSNMDVV
jgi:hypothetical protein